MARLLSSVTSDCTCGVTTRLPEEERSHGGPVMRPQSMYTTQYTQLYNSWPPFCVNCETGLRFCESLSTGAKRCVTAPRAARSHSNSMRRQQRRAPMESFRSEEKGSKAKGIGDRVIAVTPRKGPKHGLECSHCDLILAAARKVCTARRQFQSDGQNLGFCFAQSH